MPWKEATEMSLRVELVTEALQEGANIRQLCQRFGISRKTAYKWIKRYQDGGVEDLIDRSRRPLHSPMKSNPEVEKVVVEMRQEHPVWGARKIQARLKALKKPIPASHNTITAILHRHELIESQESIKHTAYRRFERDAPNQLWQMDFKGYFSLQSGGFCHPLTVLDDHSRFLIGLQACPNEKSITVKERLTALFQAYGLPERMLMDNGSPWGTDPDSRYTILTVWLMRLGIAISHGRPYHPQTQGKDERLHRTLIAEVLRDLEPVDLPTCQTSFDAWRYLYNYERPHESLDLEPPSSRYQASPHPFPEKLPLVTYDEHEIIRKVDSAGRISFLNRAIRVGKAFRGFPVAIRKSELERLYEVYFCSQKVVNIPFDDHNDED